MKILFAALGLLGVAAAAVSSNSRQAPPAARTAPRAPAPLGPGRIAIGPAELRQAYALGLVDRPVRTILDVPDRMTYGEYRWNDAGVPAGPTWVRVDLRSQLISVFRS